MSYWGLYMNVASTMAIVQAWVWITFVLFTISQPATCETFHIIPSTNSPCPGELTGDLEPCFTLRQFTSGEYRQYTSDPSAEIVLEFQPGRHTPGYSPTFASQLVSFTMNSVNSAEIDCQSDIYQINHVQNVYINGIKFIRCIVIRLNQ